MPSAFVMRRPHGVVGRLWRRVALVGLIATTLVSSLALFLEYRQDVAALEERFTQLGTSSLPSIGENLWLEDHERVALVIAGMAQIPAIARVELYDATGKLIEHAGTTPDQPISRRFIIERDYQGQRLPLGELYVIASTQWLQQRTWDRLWGIVGTNLVLIVVLCVALYALTHRSVIRPLKTIADYAALLGRSGPTPPPPQSLELFRQGDEMWELMRTLQLMSQELAQGQDHLSASEQRFRNLFSASPVSLWEEDFSPVAAALDKLRPQVADFDAWLSHNAAESLRLADQVRIIDVNDATLQMHRARDRDELIRRLPLIFTPESLPAFQAQLRAIWNHQRSLVMETKVRTLDGEIRSVVLRWKVADGHEDSLDRVIVSQEDITERKAVTDMLAETLDKLRRSNAELERVTFVTAHDLLEPVRAVVSFSQLVQRHVAASGADIPQLGDDLSFLQAAALRMKEQVEGLHRYAAICQDQAPTSRLSLNDVVRDAQHRLALSSADAILEIGPLPEVVGNGKLLTELFTQLLENCLKFRSAAPPCITIAAKSVAEGWQVSVTDNGIGIEPAFADMLFDLFRRLHAPGQFGGVGIGLPLCRKIMERHDGNIAIDTAHQGGTRIVLTFPSG